MAAVFGGPDIVTLDLQLALDAGSTRSYPGTGTSWFDLSGYDRHFTWSSSPSWNSAGYFNTVSNTATGPASNSFGITNGTGYSIITVYQTTTTGGNAIFKFFDTGGGRGIFSHPGWTNDTIYFDQGGCCADSQRIIYNNSNVSDSGVYNFVCYRSTVSTRSIFYNGSKVTDTNVTAATITLGTTGVQINPTDEGYNWTGRIAQFYVYNRGLSDAEVQQNYIAFKNRYGV
jgi:hypothetical protein